MSKIICEVCGTSYPETAAQCPICGCVRPADVHGVAGDTNENEKSGYTYVKGGRFSKSNVRKRIGAAQAAARESSVPDAPEKQKDSRGLVITAVLLLLAIIAIIIYIAVKFLMPPEILDDPNSASSSTTGETIEILCSDIYLDVKKIVFAEQDESRMLYATAWPADTTEKIYYESSDEDVVIVNQSGKVTAVGPGEAWITVTCGTVTVTCDVECTFEDETTEDTSTQDTTDETTESTVDENVEFKLNRKDITFSRKGETWVIYDGTIPLSSITWTSDNESVCTISNGKVVAVGYGDTKIHAEYNGQKVSCIIRCSFKADSSGGTGGNVSEDGGGVSEDGGSSADGQTKTVISDGLNMRNGAGTSYDIVASFGKGDKVTVTETKTVNGVTWGKVPYNGYDGWICMDYVE